MATDSTWRQQAACRGEALLGLATTEELLREIVARLEDSPTTGMRHVAYWCRSAADWGPLAEREYRTVDS